MANRTIAPVASRVQLATSLTSRRAPASPFFRVSSCRVGTNAAVSAPSPSSRRNRLGKVKAVTKAEARAVVPNTAVIAISRARPSTREPIVTPDTIPTLRSAWPMV